jgi:hypothetical protein
VKLEGMAEPYNPLLTGEPGRFKKGLSNPPGIGLYLWFLSGEAGR